MKFEYHCYAVSSQIYKKITSLISGYNVIAFNFFLADQEAPITYYEECNLMDFFDFLQFIYPSIYENEEALMFRNWLNIQFQWGGDFIVTHSTAEFNATWSFTEDQIRKMRRCSLDIYTGQAAKYIWEEFEGKPSGFSCEPRRWLTPDVLCR